jgi:hypothetical protein
MRSNDARLLCAFTAAVIRPRNDLASAGCRLMATLSLDRGLCTRPRRCPEVAVLFFRMMVGVEPRWTCPDLASPWWWGWLAPRSRWWVGARFAGWCVVWSSSSPRRICDRRELATVSVSLRETRLDAARAEVGAVEEEGTRHANRLRNAAATRRRYDSPGQRPGSVGTAQGR